VERSPAGGETIFAPSTPPGIGSSAIIRISGPRALRAATALCDEGGGALARARGFQGTAVVLGIRGLRIPAWGLVFRSPRSYTREDVVELTLPGSAPLVGAVARALESGGLARWARPGEFTLRAFLGGRIDLSQAEAVGAMIGAAGESEARASRRCLRGELRARVEEVAEGIIAALALIEAALDFPDEDLPQLEPRALAEGVARPERTLAELRRSASLRLPGEGNLRVVLAGFPNAGKSSLLNALAGREVAIASEHAGTTRDPLRAVTVHGGRRIEWIDVAGSQRLEDFFEQGASGSGARGGAGGDDEAMLLETVRRLTRIEVASADVIVWVADPTARLEEAVALFEKLPGPREGGARSRIFAVQKSDLLDEAGRRGVEDLVSPAVIVSAKARRGLEALVERVLCEHQDAPGPRSMPAVFLVSAHQAAWLESAGRALERARATIEAGAGAELAAVDLREALRSVGEVKGDSPREAVLEHIFSRFCIGK
jgi:tRNA modification GTPase